LIIIYIYLNEIKVFKKSKQYIKMSTNEENIFDKPPDTVTINEVAFMHQIIQACAQRGAFKPEEFKDVGALNDKLKALLEYARKLEEAAKKQSEQAESTSVPSGSEPSAPAPVAPSAPSGSAPSGSAPSGSAPSGSAPSAPSGSAESLVMEKVD
jgi:hypothetical protein